ncbi:hypothetical protein QFZ31_001055 [Neobacillus niacini]|uniref:ion channel n=1 Tax=Neobacillus driksii TaxID=3035913 RepID=UPI002787B60A|nr:hypothetical protein [Neobacillus niacini]
MCTGFGEKPERLWYIYIILQIVFLFINFPFKWRPLEYKGLDSELGTFNKIVSTFYFNSTTMLTSVYGDISPMNSVTRLVVVLQQVLGFVISGSFIALFLRKIFRF